MFLVRNIKISLKVKAIFLDNALEILKNKIEYNYCADYENSKNLIFKDIFIQQGFLT